MYKLNSRVQFIRLGCANASAFHLVFASLIFRSTSARARELSFLLLPIPILIRRFSAMFSMCDLYVKATACFCIMIVEHNLHIENGWKHQWQTQFLFFSPTTTLTHNICVCVWSKSEACIVNLHAIPLNVGCLLPTSPNHVIFSTGIKTTFQIVSICVYLCSTNCWINVERQFHEFFFVLFHFYCSMNNCMCQLAKSLWWLFFGVVVVEYHAKWLKAYLYAETFLPSMCFNWVGWLWKLIFQIMRWKMIYSHLDWGVKVHCDTISTLHRNI